VSRCGWALALIGSGLSGFALVWGCGLDAVGALGAGNAGEGGLPDGTVVVQADGNTCVVSGTEACGDGLDNDCNGAVDCDDPACGASVCVGAAPSFTYVAVVEELDAGTKPADAGTCPSGWQNHRVLLENGRVTGTDCTCQCGAGPNACLYGTETIFLRTGSSSCNDGNPRLAMDGGCFPVPATDQGAVGTIDWANVNGAGAASARSEQNGPCPAIARPPRVQDDGVVALCDLEGTAGACASGGACVVAPGVAKVCALRAGDHACPAAFPSKRLVRGDTQDTRTCAACSCATVATQCNNQLITFYTNAACNQNGQASTLDGFCNDLSGGGQTPTHYRFTATPDVAGCAPAQLTVPVDDGGLTFGTTATLCCPP
jgi:hypothetical protein